MKNATTRQAAVSGEITLSGEASHLTLTFADGRKLVMAPEALPSDELRMQAMLHGLKQKLVDAAAIGRNPDTGRAASLEDKYQAVKTVYDRVLAGQWNATREGGATGGLLLRALAELYPAKTVETLREYLAGKTDAEKSAMRKNAKVAAIIERLRAESGDTSGIDSDALLGELD